MLLLAWLIIGAIAGGQRHYYDSHTAKCAKAGTIDGAHVAGVVGRARHRTDRG